MTLEIEITDAQTEALSEILKRIGYTEIRALSQSDDEAINAQYAFEQIRQALSQQGYNPR